MEIYEIRVLGDGRAQQIIFKQQYLNDHAAIRSARSFAEDRHFEVWRGLNCIFGIGSVARHPASGNRPAA